MDIGQKLQGLKNKWIKFVFWDSVQLLRIIELGENYIHYEVQTPEGLREVIKPLPLQLIEIVIPTEETQNQMDKLEKVYTRKEVEHGTVKNHKGG